MPEHVASRRRTQSALKKLGAEALISTHAIEASVGCMMRDRDKPMNADKIYRRIRDFKEPAIEAAVMAATAQPGTTPGVEPLSVADPKLYYAVLRLGLYVWKVVSRSAATYRALLMLPEEERSRTGRDFQQSSTVTAGVCVFDHSSGDAPGDQVFDLKDATSNQWYGGLVAVQ